MRHRYLPGRKTFVLAALTAVLVAVLGAPVRALEPAETGAIAAGAIFLLGPEAKTDGFFYITSFVDLDGNGEYTLGEPTREYRLDIKASTFWSFSRYGAARVHKSALSLEDFQSTWKSEVVLNDDDATTRTEMVKLIRKNERTGTTDTLTTTTATVTKPKHGLRPPQEIMSDPDYVPVIVLSADPEPVIAALLEVSQNVRKEQELHRLVAAASNLKRTEERVKELKKQEQRLKSESKEVAGVVERISKFNGEIVKYTTTPGAGGAAATFTFVTGTPLHTQLTALQDALTTASGLQLAGSADERTAAAESVKTAKERVKSEYSAALRALLEAAGIPTKGKSDADLRKEAENYIATN